MYYTAALSSSKLSNSGTKTLTTPPYIYLFYTKQVTLNIPTQYSKRPLFIPNTRRPLEK